jgi:PAS domain S-box-containing protein
MAVERESMVGLVGGCPDDFPGMSPLVHAFDWAATPLGPMAGWPRNLLAAVELILPNAFASVVLWGPDLIQVYNDGYARIMADKHPAFLGRPNRECWPEAWHINAPIYERVWRGESVMHEDALYPLVRHGELSDAWLDLCYSPIRDDAGGVGGILVTLVETTAWHRGEEARQRAELEQRMSEERYRRLFDSMDEGCCVMEVSRGDDGSIAELTFREVNEAFERQAGFTDVVGQPVSRFMPNLESYWREAFTRVMATGEPVRVENYLADSARWYSVQFARIGGEQSRLLAAVFQDITERKNAGRLTSRLAAIVESCDDAIISKDLDGIIQTWNAGAQRIFGYTAAEVIGKPVTLLMPPERVDEEPGILRRIRRGERIDHYETVRQCKDGTRLDVSLTISPIFDGDGNVVAASKIARDITGRKRMETALADVADRRGFLLKLADSLRPLADPAEVQRVASRLAGEYLGVANANYAQVESEDGVEYYDIRGSYAAPGRPSVDGRYRLDDFPGATAEVLRGEPLVIREAASDSRLSALDKASCAAKGFASVVMVPLVKADRLLAVFAAHGPEPRAWRDAEVELLREVAARTWSEVERARAEASLRDSEVRLQRAVRSKDEFIAMLSHELRNPLAPITTTLELMRLRAPDVFTSERETIQGQVTYLTGLVDDLLDVARIASGKVEMKAEPLEVAEIVEAAVETIQPAMEKHRQSLEVDVDDGLLVSGDRRRLVQVLVNLLGNAAKYSPPDRIVRLLVTAEGGDVVLRVRDEGHGIEPDLLPEVFDLFRQGTQQLDRPRGGLGLGLAIVANLVKLHGGSVSAASDGSGKGSEFAVRLPRLQRAADSDMALPVSAEERPAVARATSRTRVLIVDDYAVAAESMSLLLETMGYSTYLAYDGASALRALKEFSPQVALVDIGLPVMDGYEIARAIRAMPEFARLPLVAVTGYGQPSDQEKVRAAGFDEHLVKPLEAGKIGAAIEKLLAVA